MALLRKIHSILPQTPADLLRGLYNRRRYHISDYDASSFFESWHKSNRAFADRCTIGYGVGELRSLYHYKSVERNIIYAMLVLNPSWYSSPSALRVLDIGSGTGHWLSFYANEIGVEHVTGVDISETAVEKMNERFGECDKIQAHMMDISSDETDLGKFHIANAIGVMFHIVDDASWERAISNIAGRLHPGGGGIIGGEFGSITRNRGFTKTNEFDSWDACKAAENAESSSLYVYKRLRSRRAWRRALRRNGCKAVAVIPANCQIPTPENNLLVFRKMEHPA